MDEDADVEPAAAPEPEPAAAPEPETAAAPEDANAERRQELEAEYGAKTVRVLRDMLRARGLHTTGRKAELIARLLEDA